MLGKDNLVCLQPADDHPSAMASLVKESPERSRPLQSIHCYLGAAQLAVSLQGRKQECPKNSTGSVTDEMCQ